MIAIITKILTLISLIYTRVKRALITQATAEGTKKIEESKGDDDDIEGLQKLRNTAYGINDPKQPK